jgi:hypothetical protein
MTIARQLFLIFLLVGMHSAASAETTHELLMRPGGAVEWSKKSITAVGTDFFDRLHEISPLAASLFHFWGRTNSDAIKLIVRLDLWEVESLRRLIP